MRCNGGESRDELSLSLRFKFLFRRYSCEKYFSARVPRRSTSPLRSARATGRAYVREHDEGRSRSRSGEETSEVDSSVVEDLRVGGDYWRDEEGKATEDEDLGEPVTLAPIPPGPPNQVGDNEVGLVDRGRAYVTDGNKNTERSSGSRHIQGPVPNVAVFTSMEGENSQKAYRANLSEDRSSPTTVSGATASQLFPTATEDISEPLTNPSSLTAPTASSEVNVVTESMKSAGGFKTPGKALTSLTSLGKRARAFAVDTWEGLADDLLSRVKQNREKQLEADQRILAQRQPSHWDMALDAGHRKKVKANKQPNISSNNGISLNGFSTHGGNSNNPYQDVSDRRQGYR